MTASFLRRTATASEKALWRRLRPGFAGHRFEFQAPLFGYAADFYCRRLRLVVEVDGSSHRGREQLDRLREDVFRANRVHVVRIPAAVVLDNIEQALEELRSEMETRCRQLTPPRRPPIGAPAPERCRHGNDAVLCERCKLVKRAMRERRGDESGEEEVPRRPPPPSRNRYGTTPGLVNLPPESPGSISHKGY